MHFSWQIVCHEPAVVTRSAHSVRARRHLYVLCTVWAWLAGQPYKDNYENSWIKYKLHTGPYIKYKLTYIMYKVTHTQNKLQHQVKVNLHPLEVNIHPVEVNLHVLKIKFHLAPYQN